MTKIFYLKITPSLLLIFRRNDNIISKNQINNFHVKCLSFAEDFLSKYYPQT